MPLQSTVRSIRDLCKPYRIPRSTFRDRLIGGSTHTKASIPQQILSRVQEQRLANWVLTQLALGVPPTHTQLREFAGRILEAQGAPQNDQHSILGS